jgi:hypothetical protein
MYEITRHLENGTAERAYYGTDRTQADAIWATITAGIFAHGQSSGIWSAIDRRGTPLAITRTTAKRRLKAS